MAHVFHVEFGINDTPLTRALECGNYASAERLILDCTNPSYLDEGCYQRTPLYICLCGVDQDAERVIARNLYLARLLIERGANINHRVPVTYFGFEFASPGKNCLELLVDYYIDLTSKTSQFDDNGDVKSRLLYKGPSSDRNPVLLTSVVPSKENLDDTLKGHQNWSPSADVVVGMDKGYLLSVEDVLDNILDLISIVLSNGGNPNVTDEKHMTALHNVCMHSQNTRLLQLLCEHGADVNAVDAYGNTPLLALCDLPTAQLCDSFDDYSPSSDDSWPSAGAAVSVNPAFLRFLLRIKDININHQNNLGRTALFHCVLRGDADSTCVLLRSGADANLKGTVWETRRKKRELSPLLAMFLSVPTQHQLAMVDTHRCLVSAIQPFAHLVDAGYFSTPGIKDELSELLEQQFPEFSHLRQQIHQLVHLMFGGTTCTLKQLAARQLFRRCLIDSIEYLCRIVPAATFQHSFTPEDLCERSVYEEYIELVVNHTVLRGLVSLLGLPKDTVLYLEVELLLQRLGLRVAGLKIHRPDPSETALSDEDLSSDDSSYSVSQDEGDSDLEYW